MGRNGVADRTSCLNLDEEHQTPKGDTRLVRVRFELSRQTLDALPPRKARMLLKTKSHSGEDGSLYPATALWQFRL